MKRFLMTALVAAMFVVPTAARADSATYTAPYTMGATGGDTANVIRANPDTGEVTVLRLGGTAVSGSLGCLAQGGIANFVVRHTVVSTLDHVTVNASQVVLDGFTWIKATASIVGGEGSLGAAQLNGPIAGDVSLDVPTSTPLGEHAAPGDVVEIRFGLETASSCPSVDGGHALFTSIVVS